MAWVKIDDNAPHHRKQLAAGPIACWLWVCGLAYCQKHATDGLIPGDAVSFLGVTQWAKAVPFLVKSGLWVEDAPHGYRVHDFLTWNDSAATRREKIAESAERVARFRASRKGGEKRDGNAVTATVRSVTGNGTPLPLPLPKEQERTAPAALRPVEKSEPTPWKVACAIAHKAIEAYPTGLSDQTDAFKAMCAAQRIDYAALGGDDHRPLYVRALDYVAAQRANRGRAS